MNRLFIIVLILIVIAPGFPQTVMMEWMKLVPLKSTREQVEKLLGTPKIYFPRYGSYETSLGDFSVWYSTGKCEVGIEGRQWIVPKGTMTGLELSSRIVRPPSWFLSDTSGYQKATDPQDPDRFDYTLPNGSIGLRARQRSTGGEIAELVWLEPRHDQKDLLCPTIGSKSDK